MLKLLPFLGILLWPHHSCQAFYSPLKHYFKKCLQTIFKKKILQLIFSLYESHPLQSTWFAILHSTIHLLTSCQILQFLNTVLSHYFWVETLSMQKVCHSPFSTNISSFFLFSFFFNCVSNLAVLCWNELHINCSLWIFDIRLLQQNIQVWEQKLCLYGYDTALILQTGSTLFILWLLCP